jgi:tetratricopeptide (TPR) repeat protein
MRNLLLLVILISTVFTTTFSQNTKGGSAENTNPKSTTGDVYALIVGVSDYQYSDTYDPLQFADVDGRVFYNYMVSSNGGKIPKENIDTLFNNDATASAVLTKIDEFIDRVKPNDIFYFYFSGHGDAVNAEYPVLLPFDAPPSRGGKEKNHYRTGLTVLQITTIKNMFKDIQLKGAKVIFISDACRTNELAGGSQGNIDVFKSIMDEDAGELRLTSCSANQVSFEGPQWGGGRGLFSYHLVNGLKGMADRAPEDNRITVRELNNYLTEMVEAQTYDTLEMMPRQIPQMNCSNRWSNCEYLVLNSVTKAEKDKVKLEIKNSTNVSELTAAKGKGVHLAAEMKAIGKGEVYNEFLKRIKANSFLGAEGAYGVYETISADTIIPETLKKEFKNMLSNYLLTSVNKVINAYLNASKNHKVYTKEYFVNAHSELKLFSELSPTYYYNKSVIDANLLFLEGHSYYTSQKTTELLYGLSRIDSALVLNPDAAYLYNIKGILEQSLHQYSKAKASFKKGMELAPNWIYPVTNVGIIYNILNQKDSTMSYYLKSLSLDSNYSRTYSIIARGYERFNDLDSAYFYANKGLEKDPLDPETLVLLGDLKQSEKKYTEALNYYYKATSVDSMYVDAYAGALVTHVETYVDQSDSLEYYILKMLYTDVTNPSTYVSIADLLVSLDQYPTAEDYYELAIGFDSLNTDAWNGLGFVYYKKESYDTAIGILTYSTMLDSNYALTHNLLGLSYYQRKDYASALLCLLKANEIDPWSEKYTFSVGYLYYLLNDFQNAIVFYKKNFEQANRDLDVYYELVKCYAQLNDQNQAISYLRQGLVLAPDRFSYTEMKNEEGLKNLKKNKEYKKILKGLKKVESAKKK